MTADPAPGPAGDATADPAAGPAPALVTVVRGRHHHLRRQLRWVARMEPAPRVHVVVAVGDPRVADVVAEAASAPTRLLALDVDGPLPLAAARNRGIEAAADAGARSVVLLDVDCLPERGLAGEHAAALASLDPGAGPAVVSGRVRYLPEGLTDDEHRPERLAVVGTDHPARVVPSGDRLVAGDPDLLWTLNISATIADLDRIGGFDERYVGYGGEDTDLGRRLDASGGTMWWSGRAGAFHQYHPVSSPPIEHAADIARNATLFRRTWGEDPMPGWLVELERLGHLRRTADGWEHTGGAGDG